MNSEIAESLSILTNLKYLENLSYFDEEREKPEIIELLKYLPKELPN